MTKKKFFKVYSGPGYPIDPKADELRALDHFVNDVEPTDKAETLEDVLTIMLRQPRTFDYDRLNQWLRGQLN